LSHDPPPGQLRLAQILTMLMVPLAAIASALGLGLPDLYRETAWTVPQVRGQDFVTLVVVPALFAAPSKARRGSARGAIWIGLLGYLFYTYTGAAFAYRFNELFLLYVVLFSLSIFALVAIRNWDQRGQDPTKVRHRRASICYSRILDGVCSHAHRPLAGTDTSFPDHGRRARAHLASRCTHELCSMSLTSVSSCRWRSLPLFGSTKTDRGGSCWRVAS